MGSTGGALRVCQPTITQTHSIVACGVGVLCLKPADNCLIHLPGIYQ